MGVMELRRSILLNEPHLETASGNVASFNTDMCRPVADCTVNVDPVQDLHGYDSPWPGGGHYNQWDEEWELGMYDVYGNKYANNNAIRSKNYVKISPNTAYYFLIPNPSTNRMGICWYDNSKNLVYRSSANTANGLLQTSLSNAYFLTFYMDAEYGTTYKNDIAINYPSTVTTYSPYSNLCPITGHTGANVWRTGVNVWDEETRNGYYDTSGGFVPNNSYIASKNKIRIIPNTHYRFVTNSGNIGRICYYDNDENFISSFVTSSTSTTNIELIAPSNAVYLNFDMKSGYGATYNHDISINYPSTDTSYHPGHVASYPISFSSAGTVYGGTLDVVNGVLRVTKAEVNLGSLYWTYYSGSLIFRCTSCPAKNNNIICSNYATNSQYLEWANVPDCSIQAGPTDTIVKDTRYSDAQAFTTAMSGVQLVYELATPVEYTLSPTEIRTLLGQNNLWADCGEINNVTYWTH